MIAAFKREDPVSDSPQPIGGRQAAADSGSGGGPGSRAREPR
eukprot:SAG22_NODE_1366_length_4595_cov_5.475979_5_plen_42_part_00